MASSVIQDPVNLPEGVSLIAPYLAQCPMEVKSISLFWGKSLNT